MVNIRNTATMTPAGFPWYDQWGSARYASNNAFLHAVDYSGPFFIKDGFKHSALGNNSSLIPGGQRIACDVNHTVKVENFLKNGLKPEIQPIKQQIKHLQRSRFS